MGGVAVIVRVDVSGTILMCCCSVRAVGVVVGSVVVPNIFTVVATPATEETIDCPNGC